jgi:catechol 2,3-dioxygenase-like lactoylglutathione lyase family enzyme
MGFLAGVDHINLTIDEGAEALARAEAFYGGLLGLEPLARVTHAESPMGAWYHCGAQQVHLSAEAGAAGANRASRRHAGFLVANLDALGARLKAAGVEVKEGNPLPGQNRFFARDPFGNRLEFLQQVE